MPFEADLAQALDRTTDSLDPDLTALLDGAVERGRRRRRRRTAGIVAGAGACAAIAAAGLVLPGVLAGTGSGGAGIETVALAMPRSAVSGTQMIHALEATFPGGRYSQVTGQGNNPSDPSAGYVANAGLVVDDGHGAARVGVSAVRLKLPLADGDGLSCERTPARAEGDTCALSELPSSAALPGGAVVMSERTAAERPAGAGTAHRWTVTVTVKSTGAQVQLTQWNSLGGGTGADVPEPTRTAPPLSEEQAVAALTGATWAPVLGAVG
ncbi:hypothetical protein [Streptomyces showdoensis]|uniref:Uncharacterized protein n=1 Tax=Streptomyces showdoensis TaxID=68268 RepID=A0A2P2GN07_STREW|nr:hypothetical protein [Streptomyces showdoensis]KKZ72892.1 hypothetical protein VO63_16275 [Streptomyces showdoensis]